MLHAQFHSLIAMSKHVIALHFKSLILYIVMNSFDIPPLCGISEINPRFCLTTYTTKTIVPVIISPAPNSIFQVKTSCRKTTESKRVRAILSLSTGATCETLPN